MNRRDFLTLMSSTAAMAILALSCTSAAQSSDRKILVVLKLAGGNDGLNTILPYNDPNYRKLRPTIAIKGGIPISNQLAFHPTSSGRISLGICSTHSRRILPRLGRLSFSDSCKLDHFLRYTADNDNSANDFTLGLVNTASIRPNIASRPFPKNLYIC